MSDDGHEQAMSQSLFLVQGAPMRGPRHVKVC